MSKRYPDFKDINDLERFTSADYCEARSLLAYSSNKTGIHLLDLTTGEEKRITAGGAGEGNVQFSNDAERMMFLSNGSFGRQCFIYNIETETVDQVTKASSPVIDPVLSPDGTMIVFNSPISAGTAIDYSKDKVNDLDNAIVIEDFGYKFDGMGYFTPDSHMHLMTADVSTGECRRLTTGVFDFLHPAWCPDNEHVICIGNQFRSKSESIGYDLLKINVKTQEMTRLTEGLWMVSYPNPVRPAVTPDGRYAVAGVMNYIDKSPEERTMSDKSYPEVYLHKIALDGSSHERFFERSDNCYQCVQFPYNAGCGWGLDKLQIDEEGRYAYYVSGWQGQGNIYRTPISGGTGELVAGGKQVWHGLGRIQNGKMLAARSTCILPEEYYIIDTRTGDMEKVLQSAKEWIDDTDIQETFDFFFDTEDGSDRVHAFITPPYSMEADKKYPVLVYVHGGPHPFYTYGFTPEHLAFAAEGYGVLCCNPRGSSGYGWEHQDFALSMDGHAFNDILQMVDEACDRYSWIDPDRIAITGGSYGGYMTNYAATHSKRFKCYITQRSISNDMISYANSDMQGESLQFERYEDFMIDCIDRSTISLAEEIDRPLLILHGSEDLRTPVEGAHQLFVAVKDLHPDLPVRMVLFPHTGHDQATDPRFKGRYHREMAEWLRKYL